MMGRAHSLSGAGLWLAGSATYTLTTGQELHPTIVVMGTALVAGAALAPDLDSYTATVTRSFGIFGRVLYHLTNFISLFIYRLTKTQRDADLDNGHRTFTHTAVSALLAGVGVWAATTLIPGTTELMGKPYENTALASLILMAFFLHLGLAGLFSKQIKKAKGVVGPYVLMAVSLVITAITAYFLPTGNDGINGLFFPFAVTTGLLIHILGDLITLKGVPFVWPLKIIGKRWYDVALPGPFRIKAGGPFELSVLTPIFVALILGGLVLHILLGVGVVNPLVTPPLPV
jgi:membrane-bound metal-dependent hydrolase YbcI (DUF457 family)